MKNNKVKAEMLPNYFKKIGVLIMIVTFVVLVILKIMHSDILHVQSHLFRIFSINTFLLGLFFVAAARDKVEDEMTAFIRLKSMQWAFLFSIIYVIFRPFEYLIWGDPIEEMQAQGLVLLMLIAYLLMYFIQKKRK